MIWCVAAALVVIAATMVVTTILAFGDRGVVGAVGVGFALAAGPVVAAWGVLKVAASIACASAGRQAL